MPSTRTKGGFYAVNKGKEIGVFYTWSECEERVKGYPGAKFRKFSTREDAEAFAFGHSQPPPTSQCSLPSGSKPTRLDNIIAALSQMPSSQPSSTPPATQGPACSQSQRRNPEASQKRLQEIMLALTTPPSTSEPFAIQATSSQSSTFFSQRSSQEESMMSSTPPTSPQQPIPKYKVPIAKPLSRGWSSSPSLSPNSSRSSSPVQCIPQPSRPRFSDDGPLSQYFSQRPSFSVKLEKSSPLTEFNRMCRSSGLEGDERKDAYEEYKVAMSQEFNSIYGTDVDCLESWQKLCSRIGISPIPATLDECRDVVNNTYVNLVDLISPTAKVQIFDTVHELADYSMANNKIFPQERAHAGELLIYLLRHIYRPELDSERRILRHKQIYRGKSRIGENLTRNGRIDHGRRPY